MSDRISSMGLKSRQAKIGTNCLPTLHACVVGRNLTVQLDCLNGRVVWKCQWGHALIRSPGINR